MSPWIVAEARILAESILTGAELAFIYGFLRLWRRLVRHGWFWTGAEDIIYWCFSALTVFSLLYEENDGVLRLYVVGSVLLSQALCSFLLRK